MTSIDFDAHEFYSALVESGVNENKAAAFTKAFAKIEKARLEELTTKNDLAETKTDIVKWIAAIVISTTVAQFFVIIGVLKLLGKI